MPADLSRLKAQLLTSGLSQKDQPLFQIINQLIDGLQGTAATVNVITGGGGGGSFAPAGATYLTVINELATLINSRRLAAGSNVTFDISVAGVLTINVTIPPVVFPLDYVVASDGALPTPSPMNDGFGNFIYIPYTP